MCKGRGGVGVGGLLFVLYCVCVCTHTHTGTHIYYHLMISHLLMPYNVVRIAIIQECGEWKITAGRLLLVTQSNKCRPIK